MQRSMLREKVVQVYEKLFAGQDITGGRAEFWDEFFLLRVNIKVLLSYFDKVPQEHITDLKPHLSRLYCECLQRALNTSHWQRIANALQTADCLLLGAFQSKNMTLSSEERLKLLIPTDRLVSAKAEYMKLCTASFVNDWPPLLQELVINSMTIRCVLLNHVNENPLFEWLMDESLFELLGTLISDSCLRCRFGFGACRLLGLLSHFQRKEMNNPFLMKISQVKDEILLNSISAVISFALSGSTRKYNEYLHSSSGIFPSISNMLGGRRVEGQRQDFSVHDGLLLCLHVIILRNPRFSSLFYCSHTHTDTHQHSPMKFDGGSSYVKLMDTSDVDWTNENYAPYQPTVDPRNLMADLIEYASVVMQGIRGDSEGLSTCSLCFKIMSHATMNLSVCRFLHEYNIHFTIQLHRAPLRHRKSSIVLLDRSSNNTMAAVLLDLLVEFFCTHLMKSFPFEIHGECLDICYHLLSHQKEHGLRLNYDWRQLWKALFDLIKYITKPDGPCICEGTFTTLLKIVGIFNFFITFGDCFLTDPNTYDDLYYELIRMKDVVERLIQFVLQVFFLWICIRCCLKYVNQHCSQTKGTWESLAMDLRESVQNLKVIVRHFNDKISTYIAESRIPSLTEAQVFELIQSNYESLSLRVYKDLYKYNEQVAVDVDGDNDLMLVGIIQSIRRDCLKAAMAYQLRFKELDVIH
ncbi:Armadillo-like helical domain-containing protein 3 [Taenia crassiceps]|uniref:Armadillo-like helical domain-containing protein 3 n=1 Tax=Taenia crassiceps TaxID=6207 RepID=A0ABR4QQ92_9CEST